MKDQFEIGNRFRFMEFSIKTNQNCLISTDEYIDKYLPFKIQYLVCDTLHSILDTKMRKKLIDFEEPK